MCLSELFAEISCLLQLETTLTKVLRLHSKVGSRKSKKNELKDANMFHTAEENCSLCGLVTMSHSLNIKCSHLILCEYKILITAALKRVAYSLSENEMRKLILLILHMYIRFGATARSKLA